MGCGCKGKNKEKNAKKQRIYELAKEARGSDSILPVQ
jgi:hypothetical protein